MAARGRLIERQVVDDLIRAEGLPNADLRDLIDRARQFLADHPDERVARRGRAAARGYVRRLDDRDIDRARDYSRQYPTNFATRIERYQDYLKAHQAGGRYISEATEAKDRILREWDTYTYRQAYDHLVAHPDDVAEVARRLRDYLHDHPDGRYARDAQRYLDWWDKVSVPGEYRVTLRRGEVDPDVGKYLGGGGPDLGVVIEVAGVDLRPLAGGPQHPPADLGLHLPPADPLEARATRSRSRSSTTTGPTRPSPPSPAARATPWPSATSRAPSSRPRGEARPWSSPPTSPSPR